MNSALRTPVGGACTPVRLAPAERTLTEKLQELESNRARMGEALYGKMVEKVTMAHFC